MLRKLIRFEHGVLHRRIFAGILAGLLPLVLLSYLTLIGTAENQKRELISAVQRTMQAMMTAVDAELDVSLSALDTLANSSRLKTGDLRGFHAEARELMQRRLNWANVVLTTPDAKQLVNARLPFGAALPSRIAADSVAQVAANGQPLVGHVLTSPLLKKPAFAVLVPVRQDGEPHIKYVLSAPIWPSSIQNLLYKQGIPEKSVVSIVDRNFNIVARTLNQNELVGKPASPTLRKLLASGQDEGWAITTTLEGTAVYTIYKRSPSSGWTAVVGIPLEVLDNPVRYSYRLLAGSIVVAALLGVAVSLAFAHSITRPMRELQLAANAVGRGEAPAIPDTDIAEIREVGEAMAGAHSERERLLASEREAHLHEREARLQAEQANRSKDEFVAMLGHELRNPLAPIYTAAQLLKLPGTDPARVRQLSAIVERQAGHLTRLVDDILDVSRVTRKVIVLKREILDMNAIVPQAVEQVQELVASRSHRLAVIPSPEPAWIDADRTRMVQVLVNLLHNAAKYTPDGGSIVLATEVGEGKVRVAVSDDGAGVPESLLPRIFDLFAQAERTLDRAQGGLGLGLPLVRGLVELHGGRVGVASGGPGLGSTFTIELPLAAAPAVQAPPTAHGPGGASGKLDVMVVDDNLDAAEMLGMFLREHGGFEVVICTDPLAALARATGQAPDVLLLDIGMPQMDGYELARRLRANPATAGARLYAITGYGQQSDREAALAAGFDGHFAKPVDVEKLVATLMGSAARAVPSAQ